MPSNLKKQNAPVIPNIIKSISNTSSNVATVDSNIISTQDEEEEFTCAFINQSLNLCVEMKLPATLYLGQVYPVLLKIKSIDRGDEVHLDSVVNAKVLLGDMEQKFVFKNHRQESEAYLSHFMFDQVGDAKVMLVITDEEDVEFEGKLDLKISKSIDGYKNLKQELPEEILFSEQGVKLSLSWLEDIKVNGLLSEKLYKINLEANEVFSNEYTLQWLAFMPKMEHKTLDFYIESDEDDKTLMQGSLQLIMPGNWVFSLLLFKDGQYLESQLFSYEVKDNV